MTILTHGLLVHAWHHHPIHIRSGKSIHQWWSAMPVFTNILLVPSCLLGTFSCSLSAVMVVVGVEFRVGSVLARGASSLDFALGLEANFASLAHGPWGHITGLLLDALHVLGPAHWRGAVVARRNLFRSSTLWVTSRQNAVPSLRVDTDWSCFALARGTSVVWSFNWGAIVTNLRPGGVSIHIPTSWAFRISLARGFVSGAKFEELGIHGLRGAKLNCGQSLAGLHELVHELLGVHEKVLFLGISIIRLG